MEIGVKLDVNKAGQFINEPVTMRAGETDNVIKASIFKNNKPYTDFKAATFNTTKLSGAVIANDPATVSGNVISYSVAPTVTNSVGKLRNSYFLLDGKTSTESFEVAILPGVSVGSDISAYIPGLQEFQDEWEKVNSGMAGKLDDIDKSVDTFLAKVQAEINDKNSKFTDNQKTQITSAINDLKKKIETNKNDVNDMDSKLAAIKDSVKDFDVPQITADTKEALDTIKGLKIGGRNLLLNSNVPIVIDDSANTGNIGYNFVTVYSDFIAGETYTFSSKINIIGTAKAVSIKILRTDGSMVGKDLVPDKYGKVVFTFTPGENDKSLIIYAGVSKSTQGNKVICSDYKLEFGNIPTGWTPALEDQYADGPNLIKNTSDFVNTYYWQLLGSSNTSSLEIVKNSYYRNGTSNILRIRNSATSEVQLWCNDSDVKSGEIYSVQFDGFSNANLVNGDIWFIGQDYNKTKTTNVLISKGFNLSNTSCDHISRTFKMPDGIDTGNLRIDNNGSITQGSNADLYLTNIKFSQKSMIAPYSRSQSDYLSKIDANNMYQKIAAPVAATAYTAMVQDADTSAVKAQNAQIAYSLMTGDK